MANARCLPVALVLALTLFNGGCGGDDTADDPPGTADEPSTTADEPPDTINAVTDDRIVGVWTTTSGYYKHYRADGSWGIGYTPQEADADPWVWGTYTFDGSRFTYYTDPDSENCVGVDPDSGDKAGMVGVYDVSFSEDGSEQLRTVVEDRCSGRVLQDTPKMLRHQEPTESSEDPAADLYGEWRTDPGSLISFLEDGSFETVYPPWGPEPFGWGTYTFDGQTLTMVTTGGDRGCAEGQSGTYDATFDDVNSLSLSVVEDDCGARREIAASPMIRQSGDPLVGMWKTHHGYYVVRTTEGRYDLGYTPEGAESSPFGRGTYTYDADKGVLTFTSDAGTHCGAGSTGKYDVEIGTDGDRVTFTLIEDPCSARTGNMTGEQTRYSPSP